jgi:hypothetical protein
MTAASRPGVVGSYPRSANYGRRPFFSRFETATRLALPLDGVALPLDGVVLLSKWTTRLSTSSIIQVGRTGSRFIPTSADRCLGMRRVAGRDLFLLHVTSHVSPSTSKWDLVPLVPESFAVATYGIKRITFL